MQQGRRRVLRQLGLGAAGAALAGTGWTARAQGAAYPARTVRIVMPYAAGGTGDVVARAIADGLAKAWGKAVVVDNRPGAGGMIGADMVAKAEPDGYTLLFALTGLVQAPSLYTKATFNPVRDFAPISELATSHLALVVQPDVPAASIRQLVDYIRKLGKPLPYGSYGLGSSGHLYMEIFGRNAGVPLTHVPYKGEGPMLNDLLGGQLPAAMVAAVSARQHARTGKLKVIAVAGQARSPLLPDVPTFQEGGVPGLERQGWIGLFAPTGTPRAIVDKVSVDVNRVLTNADLRARMVDLGILLKGSSPAAFTDVVKQEQAYWAEAIRASDIRLD
ncbi:tripartite tricarboxylate transporter substrate binding protein [Cupriavidus oxalaticus]|uniref:Tripartite tricarboxylate transporter substrate binding protein n=1 Tax=Cupriavidus oxalaticus TaxID=96344 RepID=A0A4P7L7N9_9BURK|nr:tripartite tricarboxylate transporter substrate binding protein [Cupriavidus oxalaticus]QBY51265.1 tripartite tricarboxylate transporter substrate binding protein [Cupriavidus oxalaticus]